MTRSNGKLALLENVKNAQNYRDREGSEKTQVSLNSPFFANVFVLFLELLAYLQQITDSIRKMLYVLTGRVRALDGLYSESAICGGVSPVSSF